MQLYIFSLTSNSCHVSQQLNWRATKSTDSRILYLLFCFPHRDHWQSNCDVNASEWIYKLNGKMVRWKCIWVWCWSVLCAAKHWFLPSVLDCAGYVNTGLRMYWCVFVWVCICTRLVAATAAVMLYECNNIRKSTHPSMMKPRRARTHIDTHTQSHQHTQIQKHGVAFVVHILCLCPCHTSALECWMCVCVCVSRAFNNIDDTAWNV